VTPEVVGIIGIVLLFALFFVGVPIAIALGVVGFAGFSYLNGWEGGLRVLGLFPISAVASYSMSIIALFVLMGEFTVQAGMGNDIYRAIRVWMGHFRGGLAMATVGGCALFGCLTGSSIATIATIGKVSLPEMRKANYEPGFATGAIAAGGGLGMLIPPSMILVIYGVITTQSIGKLLVAGVLPGVLLTIIYAAIIHLHARIDPKVAPMTQKASRREKIEGLKGIWGVLVLFVVMIGGMYFGFFTPTEAAGIGTFGMLLFAVGRRKMTLRVFGRALLQTLETTAMILLIIIGATLFGSFLTVSGLPVALVEFVSGLEANRYLVLSIVIAAYLILGCFMEALSMMLVTLPIIFPLIKDLGFDPIWFGIIVLLGQEMAMISPPVGLNVYVMKAIAKDVPMHVVFRGIAPFVLGLLFCFILLIAFPQIALVLPSMMQR
jgi:tripartite ATP-independent transporter DctM subunit